MPSDVVTSALDRVASGNDLSADDAVPDEFEVSARGGGVVMAMRHRELPAEGVQFHPESVLTESGKRMLENFLAADPPAG